MTTAARSLERGAWLALISVASMLALGGCSEDADETASTLGPESGSEPAETDIVESETPRPPTDPPAPATEAAAELLEAPPSGCRFGAASRVWPAPAWVDVAGAGDALLVAGSASSGDAEEVFVVRVEPGAPPRTLARRTLEHPVGDAHRRAAPGLAVANGRGALALVDGQRRLLLATFDLATPSLEPALRPAPFADGASLRFSPAVGVRDGGWALAWTDDRDTPMRVRAALAGPDGQRADDPRDLTAAGGGAAAPVFVDGADALVFVDPRQGMSVAHRAALTADGFAPTEVARPVSLLAEPPQVAAVRAGEIGWLAYTAVGAAATTAVGLVRLDGTTPPAALVPGTGYGVLHVDGAALGGDARGGAIFAADAPRASPPTSPRVVHVRALGPDGALGAPVTVAGPSGAGARARVAVAGSTVGITFTDADGTYVAVGRCAIDASAP